MQFCALMRYDFWGVSKHFIISGMVPNDTLLKTTL